MPIRNVALDRDVRAPQPLPKLSRLVSAGGLRRLLGVVALIAIDTCCFLLAFALVPPLSGLGWFTSWMGFSLWDTLLACAIVVAFAALYSLYGRRYMRHRVGKIMSAWSTAFVLTLVIMVIVDPVGIGARYVIMWFLACTLDVTARFVYDGLLTLVFGTDGDAPPALLLGDVEACQSALLSLAALTPASRVRVVGLVTPAPQLHPGEHAAGAPPVVATTDGLQQALLTTHATQVIITDPAATNGQLSSVMEVCRQSGVTLKVLPVGLQLGTEAICYVPGLDCPLFVVRPRPASAWSYRVKRFLDHTVSALLLAVLSPLLLGIAALVKLTSRGPVLFADERVGLGQRPFRFYKFRTMVQDARERQTDLEGLNQAGGVLFKVRDDPRITKVGRVLRRLSLDELPQLINVLKGDMSLVGPRPLPLRDNELMEDWHRRRHVMLPGITGLWQVSGRSDLSFDEMVRLDLQYMETWSLRSDLYIVWHTAGAVLRSHGAY